MSHTFYPFVEQDAGDAGTSLEDLVRYPARIAVYDDAAAAPRVVIIDPQDVRSYLEEITREVTRLSHEQGGTIPFMVIREIVEQYLAESISMRVLIVSQANVAVDNVLAGLLGKYKEEISGRQASSC